MSHIPPPGTLALDWQKYLWFHWKPRWDHIAVSESEMLPIGACTWTQFPSVALFGKVMETWWGNIEGSGQQELYCGFLQCHLLPVFSLHADWRCRVTICFPFLPWSLRAKMDGIPSLWPTITSWVVSIRVLITAGETNTGCESHFTSPTFQTFPFQTRHSSEDKCGFTSCLTPSHNYKPHLTQIWLDLTVNCLTTS